MKTQIKSIYKEKSLKDGYSVRFEINGLKGHTYPKKKSDVMASLELTEEEFTTLLV